jgi:hypothetical protein
MRIVPVAALAVAISLSTGCATMIATNGQVSVKDRNTSVSISITASDRAVIERYYTARKQKGLPPGLAKRGGGLPPGLAKRDRLPPGLDTERLPQDLENQLSTLPAGYVRVRVGADIVLMDSRTQVVIDMIRDVAV